MSGIVAIFARDGEVVDRDVFHTALDRIDHRGPDGHGSWRDGPVALGHQQLQSTPASQYDSQPYRDEDLVVTADARLDNRDELFRALDISARGEPVPDSHLLLESYREWGTGCVDHLVGAFAFVIWDSAAEQVLCARDHMGVKPLYYHRSDEYLAVGSEVKSLFAVPSLAPEIDEVRVGDVLVRRFADRSNTLYRSVRRLPPAHTMRVRPDASSVTAYWDPRDGGPLSLNSDTAYERRFRELFTQAVDCRLRTPQAVGTELSGGLDSSSVTVAARAQLPPDERLHTISNTFDDVPASDEREYIEAVTQAEGIDPHYVNTDSVGSLVDADDLLSQFDQPIHNIAHFTGWERAKRADEADVGVLLTGTLGDAVVGYGFSVFVDLLRTGRVVGLFRELDATSDVWGRSRRDAFVSHVLQPLFPDSVYRRYQQVRGEPVLEERANPSLNPAFVDRIGLRSRFERHHEPGWALLHRPRQRRAEGVTLGMLTEALEAVNQRDAAFGIESRHPYADKRLVEFLVAMPSTQRFTDGWPRSIVRRSLADLLPDTVQTRLGKTSMDAAVVNALSRETDRLRAMLADPEPLPRYLNVDALERALDRFEDASDVSDARVLWRALTLWLWTNGGAPATAP